MWYLLFIPVFILSILSMLILPLPPFVLDMFFTFNIASAIIILIVAIRTTNVLNFSSFPTILLFSTLFRLSLNVASTRVILLNGHTGSCCAGHVVESFGFVLIGGNFFIGFIIFIILIIINFLVITQGSGRIAEVGARFVLDALPGKQMAIDSDLNTGMISEKEAVKRRINVHREANFYGAMDGASKFIRGDAIAGIMIMVVNLIGGFVVGIVQHDMLFLEAAKVYSILTIGDGLVSQIPSLIVSIASGIILTRTGSKKIDVGTQVFHQLFNNAQIFFLSGVIFCVLSFIPGMPNFIFLFFSIHLLALSWYLDNKNIKNKMISRRSDCKESNIFNLSWDDVQFEPFSSIELSSIFFNPAYKEKYNYLLKNLFLLRKNIIRDFGFLIPDIRIVQNNKLKDGQYRILIKGVESGSGRIFLDKLLVIHHGENVISFPGKKIEESIFDSPAFWVDSFSEKDIIEKNILIVNPNNIIIMQLNNSLQSCLHELFGFQETQQLLDRVSKQYPQLVDHLIPGIISITTLQNVLKNLLRDKISIRDIITILNTLIKYGDKLKDNIEKLTHVCRIALRKLITQKFFLKNKYINVIGLSAEIENILLNVINNKSSQLEPIFSEKLIQQTKFSVVLQKKDKLPLVLLVNPRLRSILSELFAISVSNLTVLSFSEISEGRIVKINHIIGAQKL